MSRINEFRGRTQKEAAANAEAKLTDTQHLFRMILGLSSRVYHLERRLNILFPIAKIADWRSMALMKLLDERGTFSELDVCNKAVEMEIADFEINSSEDDKVKQLQNADSEVAQKDYHAVAHIKVFKNNRELEDQQVVRTKIQLGRNELFTELDEAIIGMKVGETKRFALDLLGQTDEAEVYLLGLRKAISP